VLLRQADLEKSVYRWNDIAFGSSWFRTTPSFSMSKFCPTVTGLGPQPLKAVAMRLLRRRVPTSKPPLARRPRGAQQRGSFPLHRGTEVGHKRRQVQPWGLNRSCKRQCRRRLCARRGGGCSMRRRGGAWGRPEGGVERPGHGGWDPTQCCATLECVEEG
jgi:hypothetical protein